MGLSSLASLSLGFALGLRHALDPDHMVAVSTLVSEHKSFARFSIIGTFWGLGHTTSLTAVGIVVLFLRISIPEQVAQWAELAVASMLVILGLGAITKIIKEPGLRVHTHAHSHEGEGEHAHIHLHLGPVDDDSHGEASHRHSHQILRAGRRPFVVGLVHGLAGSAALTLVVLATIPSVMLGVAYLVLFGLGSVGGMLVMSALLGLPLATMARRFSRLNWCIRFLIGVASVAFGIMLGWELLAQTQRNID